jgi:hypothetical protein
MPPHARPRPDGQLLGGVVFWRWAGEGGIGLGTPGVALLGLTVALHPLGLPLAQTAPLAIVLPGALAVSPWLIVGVTAVYCLDC